MRQPLQHQRLSRANKFARILWNTVWLFLFRPSPKICHSWRRFLLRVFGAKMSNNSYVHASVKIWAPWNLEMAEYSCLSHFVDCYCVSKVVLGRHATVSQYSHLCTASHDYNKVDLPMITAPILIGDHAWVMADVFVGPGVTVSEGAVIAARSTVTRDVLAWTVVAGSPPKPIGLRDRQPFLVSATTRSAVMAGIDE